MKDAALPQRRFIEIALSAGRALVMPPPGLKGRCGTISTRSNRGRLNIVSRGSFPLVLCSDSRGPFMTSAFLRLPQNQRVNGRSPAAPNASAIV